MTTIDEANKIRYISDVQADDPNFTEEQLEYLKSLILEVLSEKRELSLEETKDGTRNLLWQTINDMKNKDLAEEEATQIFRVLIAVLVESWMHDSFHKFYSRRSRPTSTSHLLREILQPI